MANILKKINERERLEKSRFRQRLVMAIIGFLFLSAILSGFSWLYINNAANERRAVAAEGIKAIAYSDFSRARAYLDAAIKEKELPALEFLSYLAISLGDYGTAVKNAERAVGYKLHSSYEILGDLAILGYGRAKGVDAAISYYEQGALQEASDDAAKFREGRGSLTWYSGDVEGLTIDKVRERALELFTDNVQRALPLFKDPSEHADFVLKAYKKGAKNLEMAMGDMMFIGNDRISSNAQAALEQWQKALDNGNDAAYVRLAGAYWHGYSVPRNPQNAIDLYTAASEKKDPVALYALALITLRSSAAAERMAARLFTQASELGYGPASTALGVFALTETDDPNAARIAGQWLRVAAVDQNDLSGRILFDLMLMSGTGVGKEFSRGFDDLVKIAKVYQPAQSILNLLQKRVAPGEILRQALILSNQVLRGQIAYREGDPVADSEIKDPSTGEVLQRPFSYYKSVTTLDNSFKTQFGRLNFTPVTNLLDTSIDGQPLLSEDLAKIIVQYAPSTGVSNIDAQPMMPRPRPPRIPSDYNISDFVPPVSLLEPQTLNMPDGRLRQIPYSVSAFGQ